MAKTKELVFQRSAINFALRYSHLFSDSYNILTAGAVSLLLHPPEQ